MTDERVEETGEIERTANSLPHNAPGAAYRAFGGGSVICPGRHFAQTEILGFVALCPHSFDITGLDGRPMAMPTRNDRRIPLSVMNPREELMVRIKVTHAEKEVSWRLEM